MINNRLFSQIFFFGLVGSIGFVVDAGVLYLLKPYLGIYIGRFVSFVLAVYTTWILNRSFTFKSTYSTKNKLYEFLYYFGCMIFGGIANLASYYFSVFKFSFISENPVIGIAIGSIIGMSINFISSKFLVFRQ